MFRASGKPRRHRNAGLLVGSFRDVAQERLVKRFQRLFRISQHIPRSRLTLVHTQVIVAIYQTSRQSAKENANLEIRHLRIPLDDAPVIAVAI